MITKLTSQQEKDLIAFREEGMRIGLSTGESDKEKAELEAEGIDVDTLTKRVKKMIAEKLKRRNYENKEG